MFSHEVFVMYFPLSTPQLINVHQKDIMSVTIQHSPGCRSTTLSWLKLPIMFTRTKGKGRPAHLEQKLAISQSGLCCCSISKWARGRNREGKKVTSKLRWYKNIDSGPCVCIWANGTTVQYSRSQMLFLVGVGYMQFQENQFHRWSRGRKQKNRNRNLKREVLHSLKSQL